MAQNELFENIIKNHSQWLGYVRDRWDDESEYEDFQEYRDCIASKINVEGVSEVIKVTSSPFEIYVLNKKTGETIKLKINKRSITGFIMPKRGAKV